MAQRVRIEYFDQNEDFAPLLPRSGELRGPLTDINENANWFLVRLDEPLEYQVKVGEPFHYRLLHVSHFLVRSLYFTLPGVRV